MFRNQDIRPNRLLTDDPLYLDPDYELRFKSKRLRVGDLLIARTGYPGTTAVVPPEFEGAQSFTTLIVTPRTSRINNRYLSAYLNSEVAQRFFSDNQIGGGQKNIGVGILHRCQIAAPNTMREQEAIADVLADADAHVVSLESILEKKRALKQGVMQALLSGKRRLPGFAERWSTTKFGDVAEVRNEKINTFGATEARFCIELEQVEQMTGQLLGNSDARDRESIKYTFRRGDVLFGRLRPYLRKYWIADQDGVCSTEIWPIIPRNRAIAASYLGQTIKSDPFIEAASSAYGTHMPRSDWKAVREFEFSLPPTSEEQEAIAHVLNDMDDELRELSSRLRKARIVRHSMTQELLTGRVRLI